MGSAAVFALAFAALFLRFAGIVGVRTCLQRIVSLNLLITSEFQMRDDVEDASNIQSRTMRSNQVVLVASRRTSGEAASKSVRQCTYEVSGVMRKSGCRQFLVYYARNNRNLD